MDDWDDNVTTSNIEDCEPSVGKSYGKGRGFTPRGVDSDDRRGRGGGGRAPRGGGGRGDGRGGYNRDNSNGGDFGGRRNDRRNDEWGSGGGGGGGNWGNSDSNNGDNRGGRGGRGRRNNDWNGGGGGWGNSESNDSDSRGGHGGRGRRNDNNDGGSTWGNDNHGDSGFGSGRGGRGRGGRGGDGFGGDDGGFGNNEGGEEGEKRPPIYVPTEITDDEINSQGISVGINFKDYDSIKVNVSGDNPPKPINSFREAGLRSLILDNLEYFKYTQPTPVQKYAIPIVMSGRDLMATAQTGSGKTAAFLLPIIHCLLENQSELTSESSCCEPKALILSPTRELTTQIYMEAKKFCKGSILKVAQVYGGTAVSYQSKKLMEGAHILVATPGRLGDYLGKSILALSGIRFMVLDEADRMLDMGFRTDIENFFGHETICPKEERQTLMFSATFDIEVQRMAQSYLKDYIFLAVGIVGGACKDVEQEFIQASRAEKKKKLQELLESQSNTKGTLLFVETKRNADFIASYLSDKDFPTTSIHGDRYQQQREEALREFRQGRKDILVATSVAARGLDIKGVKHVINYDIPKSIDEYVHRIGRTGRLGNKGKATSFYDSQEDNGIANGLVTILEQAGQHVPEWLKQDGGGVGGEYNESEYGAYDLRSQNNDNFKTGTSNQPGEIAATEEW